MKKYIITILLTSMILISGCGKDDQNSLTAPSTNGEGTLSFLLDGVVWRPLAHSKFPYGYSSHGMELFIIEYDSSKNKTNDLFKIEIGGVNEDKNHLFNFKIDSVLNEGKYRIKEAEFIMEYNNRYNQIGSDINSNFVNITKIHLVYKPAFSDQFNVLYGGQYTMDSYVSGTFSMKLKNKKGDSVVISDGRFDLKYKSYIN
jgi:major membrane immunogen (membrane-anchored lipoprotein)